MRNQPVIGEYIDKVEVKVLVMERGTNQQGDFQPS